MSLVFLAPAGWTQELSVLLGRTSFLTGAHGHDSFQLELRYPLAPSFAWSASYLNEGSPAGHLRDGLAVQTWGRVNMLGGRLSLAAAGGLYRYFDTVRGAGRETFNLHGWAGIYTLSGTYYLPATAFVKLTASRVNAAGGDDANTFTLGVGWRLIEAVEAGLSQERVPVERWRQALARLEVTPFAGRSALNTLAAPSSAARGVELRYTVARHLEGTVSWLDEGTDSIARRRGVNGQVWLVDTFLAGRFTCGMGVGAYALRERLTSPPDAGDHDELVGLVSLTTAWRIAPPLRARLNWSRVSTHNNRDSDVFVFGLGLRLPG
ncbi:MAG: hypothetical protein ACHQQS_09435 [Thermoanaerobaculales bacterium]